MIRLAHTKMSLPDLIKRATHSTFRTRNQAKRKYNCVGGKGEGIISQLSQEKPLEAFLSETGENSIYFRRRRILLKCRDHEFYIVKKLSLSLHTKKRNPSCECFIFLLPFS